MENDNNTLEELLVLYALGELEPDEELTVEEELKKHPELASQVEKVRRADGLLSDVFASSDEAAQNSVVEESSKPMVSSKTEMSQGRLARRLAFSVAALALIVVVGALLYPEFVSQDVQVAMSPEEETVKSSDVKKPSVNESPNVTEIPAPSDDNEIAEDTKEKPVLAVADDVAADEMDVKKGNSSFGEQSAAPDYTPADSDNEKLPVAPAWEPGFEPVDPDLAPAPPYTDSDDVAPAAQPEDTDVDASESTKSPLGFRVYERPAMAPEVGMEPGDKSLNSPVYNIPSQRTSEGMAPIREVNPSMEDEEFLPDKYLHEMPVGQMRKQLGSPANRAFGIGPSAPSYSHSPSMAAPAMAPEPVEKHHVKGIKYDDGDAPAPGSYVILRNSVMEDNQLPDPDSVKVDQWLNYFEVANSENKKEDQQVDQSKNSKDVQFNKAVILFGEALSSAEPADVKKFEDVLDLLKKSVGDDPKRLEFKAIVEKTIEIVKRLE